MWKTIISHLFAPVRTCSKTGYMVYANFALKIVISASFLIKEVHTSVLV